MADVYHSLSQCFSKNCEHLSHEDVLRAFICAGAVYEEKIEDTVSIIESQMETHSLKFEKVHVSHNIHRKRSKFLVAYASDATFIAFRGSPEFGNNVPVFLEMEKKLTSVYHDSTVESTLRDYGSVFMATESKFIVEELLRSEKRVIFCGHRIGGAVAHMVLLVFWKEHQKGTNTCQAIDGGARSRLVSIAFGAPSMCDRMDAEKVNGDVNFSKLFFNFVHPNDPNILSLLRPESTDNRHHSIRHSIGQIVKLTVKKTAGESSNVKHNESKNRDGPTSSNMKTNISVYNLMRLGVQPGWTLQDYVVEYRSALMDTITSDAQHQPLADVLHPPNSSVKKLEVPTPAPVVSSAQWNATDRRECYIEIHGKNLLFLREHVSLNDHEPWKTMVLKDNMIVIMNPSREIPDRANPTPENASTDCIIVRTAFGETNCVVTQEFRDHGKSKAVCKLLPKVVQTLMAISRPPMPIPLSEPLLMKLDSIVHSVSGLETVRLSTELKKIVGQNCTSANLVQNINNVNSIVTEVTEFLTNSFQINYSDSNALKCALGLASALVIVGMIVAPLAGLFAAGSATAATIAESALWSVGGGAGSLLGIFIIHEDEAWINYSTLLELAVDEASSVSMLPKELPTQLSPSTREFVDAIDDIDVEAMLEWDFHSKVHQHSKSFQIWDDKVELKSKLFVRATRETKERLLKKLRIVVSTIDLYKSEVMGKRFVGIQGAEDAGKSTFIKKALQRYGHTADLPAVGNRIHTEVVKPYKLNQSTWLVDFPGSNGIGVHADEWKKFKALPSSCVLLLVFKDDIKEDQCQMYMKMKKELDTDIIVVFNKVDVKFTPRKEALYTKEYFTKLRHLAVEKLGCKEEDVHFACLDPKGNKLPQLRKEGVWGFEELADKLKLAYRV